MEGPVGGGPVRIAFNVTNIDPVKRTATIKVLTKGLLRLAVNPTPTPLGIPINLEIDAFDQSTGAVVAGTVQLTTGVNNVPRQVSFPTGSPKKMTLQSWLVAHVDGKGHIVVTRVHPSGTVTAPNYALATIPFGFVGT